MRSVKPWVFDLDGTLVDTKAAVRAAYTKAGIILPAEDSIWWGKPWRSWLPEHLDRSVEAAYEIHDLKNKAYAETLQIYGKLLPMAELALKMGGFILTGASAAAVAQIRNAFPKLYDLELLGVEARTVDKWVKLRELSPIGGFYVDDDPLAAAAINIKATYWKVILCSTL